MEGAGEPGGRIRDLPGMTISDYECEGCGYEYRGCGGLGVLESGSARQTVSCAECQALHDVEAIDLREARRTQKKAQRG